MRGGRTLRPDSGGQGERGLNGTCSSSPAEEAGLNREQEIAAHSVIAVDESVVHEQPAAVAKRVAVALLDRCPRRGADVRQEDRRFDLTGQLTQVAIAPRRRHAAVLAGTSRLP